MDLYRVALGTKCDLAAAVPAAVAILRLKVFLFATSNPKLAASKLDTSGQLLRGYP
jgi:hypothetical protein